MQMNELKRESLIKKGRVRLKKEDVVWKRPDLRKIEEFGWKERLVFKRKGSA